MGTTIDQTIRDSLRPELRVAMGIAEDVYKRLVAKFNGPNIQDPSLPKYTDPAEQELSDQITVALPSLDLAFEEAKRILDHQQKQIDGLDTKAQVFLGLIGVVLAALYANLKNLLDMHVSTVTLLGIGSAGILLGLSALLALLSYRIRKWTMSPNLARLKDYFTWEENLTKYVLFDTMDDLFNQNAKETENKAFLLSRSHSFFLAAIGILVVLFIANL